MRLSGERSCVWINSVISSNAFLKVSRIQEVSLFIFSAPGGKICFFFLFFFLVGVDLFEQRICYHQLCFHWSFSLPPPFPSPLPPLAPSSWIYYACSSVMSARFLLAWICFESHIEPRLQLKFVLHSCYQLSHLISFISVCPGTMVNKHEGVQIVCKR